MVHSERESELAVSRAEFVQNLGESGLLSADDLRKTVSALPVELGNGAAVAAHLVAGGKLTRFQADAIQSKRFGDLRVGHYEILDKLGAGGMGTVFKARHARMKRIVALKVLSQQAGQAESFSQRFQREVETIAQLSHPNIVMAFDAGEAEAGLFLVMEFVNGRDLAGEVHQSGPLSIADAVDCTLQAARGLEYAHGQGIVHRDIKPGNILRDVSGVIKVADLGLARLASTSSDSVLNPSLTQAGGVVGTLDYMSPEQALDSTAVDHRADIYSLGCTLHYLLTGRAPFTGNSIMALLLAHREKPIPLLSLARPDVPAALEKLYQRMMAKQPAERFQTMAEVVKAFEALRAAGGLANARPGVPLQASAMTSQGADVTVTVSPMKQDDPHETTVVGVPAATGVIPATSLVQPVSDLTVVLVEPSRAQVGIVRSYLQKLGIEKLYTTDSGKSAINLAKQTGAKAIISSLHLSDMHGVQLAHDLAADAECANVGFVLTTSTQADVDEAGRLPANSRMRLMLKPFDLQRLANSLEQVTGQKLARPS